MQKNDSQIIQGDVYLIPAQIPLRVFKHRLSGTDPSRITLVLGEATGHHHSVIEPDTEDAELYIDRDRNMYLRAKREIQIEHQEHKPITVPAGDYLVGIQNEYDPFNEEKHRVQD